jgi:NitT/TauT family transport system substrate-binding protein
MSPFTIQPHGRLNDWVADEKGYFADEGLDYFLNVDASYKTVDMLPEATTDEPVKDNLHGAFERYADGGGRKGTAKNAGDVSCACHWTVNQSAKLNTGVMYGKAYSICDAAIVVPEESEICVPGDLANVDVAVGYHSGSHYSAQQALEPFLASEEITLKFIGTSWSRVDAAIARKIPAVNVWGPQLYLMEQRGFRRIISTTFMMAFMFADDADPEDVEKYMRGLIRAQTDIDSEPEKYKKYFLTEIPDRYVNEVDVRRFGNGERVVPQPYTQEMFERTQSWMHERDLFDGVKLEDGLVYAEAVHS